MRDRLRRPAKARQPAAHSLISLPAVTIAHRLEELRAAVARDLNHNVLPFWLRRVHREDGGFWDGLQAEEVTVRENGLSLAVDELQPVYTDVQMVTAITLGPSFSVRDGLGVTRYEYLVQGLKGWKWDADAGDDLSLLIADGPDGIAATSRWKYSRIFTATVSRVSGLARSAMGSKMR